MFHFFSKKDTSAYYLVGLGNPGTKYEMTRHNIGFLFLDFLLQDAGDQNWQEQKKLHSSVSTLTENDTKLTLVKPQTFMNESGKATAALMSFYKTNPEQCIIIHDDVDLPFGEVKFVASAGSAGHRGVASIHHKLSSKDIPRIRIGIGKSDTVPTDAHVLQKFTPGEQQQFAAIFASAKTLLFDYIQKSKK